MGMLHVVNKAGTANIKISKLESFNNGKKTTLKT